MDNSMDLPNNLLHLSGMQTTEGEPGVLRALAKLSEKIERLESEHNVAKKKVESLGTQTAFHMTTSGDFYRRLAKTEARCNLLKQQLSQVKSMVKESTLSNVDDLLPHKPRTDAPRLASPSERDGRGGSALTSPTDSLLSKHVPRFSLPTVPSILNAPISYDYEPSVTSSTSLNPRITLSRFSSKDIGQLLRSPDMENVGTSHFSPPPSHRTRSPDRLHKSVNPWPEVPNSSLSESSQRKAYNDRRQSRERQKSSIQERDSRECSSVAGRATPLGQATVNAGRAFDSHYHITLNQMPFCSATTSGKSHSLSSNMQSLLSMVKSCHPALCSAAPLHRLRSLSGDRQRYNSKRTIITRNFTRWNSASSLEESRMQSLRGRARSLSAESISRRRLSQPISVRADLDLVPVRLRPSKDSSPQMNGDLSHQLKKDRHFQRRTVNNGCERPGNVCLRSELRELSTGNANRVVELNVGRASGAKAKHPQIKPDKRKQFLKSVRDLQYMVENDQCC